MTKRNFHSQDVSAAISDEEVARIVTQRIPRWKAACDHTEADTVVLDQRAFGRSLDEMFLMACAIRYARITNKIVMIHP